MVIGCHMCGFLVLKSPEFFGSGEIKQISAMDAVLLGGLAFIISSMILLRTVVR